MFQDVVSSSETNFNFFIQLNASQLRVVDCYTIRSYRCQVLGRNHQPTRASPVNLPPSSQNTSSRFCLSPQLPPRLFLQSPPIPHLGWCISWRIHIVSFFLSLSCTLIPICPFFLLASPVLASASTPLSACTLLHCIFTCQFLLPHTRSWHISASPVFSFTLSPVICHLTTTRVFLPTAWSWQA